MTKRNMIRRVTIHLKKPIPTIAVFFDGASKGNPGPSGYGYHISSSDLNIEISESKNIGIATNNVAEYNAVLAALTHLKALLNGQPPTHIIVYGDSQLVIKQLLGEYKVKSTSLTGLWIATSAILKELRKDGHNVELKHIMRKYNSIANALASNFL
jgi:ribonuclease HI